MPNHKPRKGDRSVAATDRRLQDGILAALEPIVSGIRETFGRTCEVVLHDYRDPEHSVRAIAGAVTGRTTGSAASEIGLRMIQQGPEASDDLNYFARLPDGRHIKSSTILLRDPRAQVFGALCINVDVTALQAVDELIREIATPPGTEEPDGTDGPDLTYHSDPGVIVDSALADIERDLGRPLARLTVAEKNEVFAQLDARGIFQLRRAVQMVADRVGLSRASAYQYLARQRANAAEQ